MVRSWGEQGQAGAYGNEREPTLSLLVSEPAASIKGLTGRSGAFIEEIDPRDEEEMEGKQQGPTV